VIAAMARRYLIIGDGAAGMTAAQTIRLSDPAGEILIVADDPNPAYYRASLTNYLLGELCEEHLWAVPPTVYSEMRIARRHARVAAVDAGRSQVWLTSGGPPFTYDALVIAAGSRARHPSFQGADLPGIGTMRTLQDVRWVMDLIKLQGLRSAVVIGGGPLGLEWAFAMKERGVAVALMVRDTVLMAGALDAVASDLLIARIRRGGIDLRLGDEVVAASPGPQGRLGAVHTKLGQTIPCELVAAAIGVICNTEFLQGSGITIGKRGGVVVDNRMRTSVGNVFACGDVAEVFGQVDQKWEPARVQGRIAGANAAGGSLTFDPGVPYFATRLFDLDYASAGEVVARDASYEEIAESTRKTGRIAYRKVILKDGKLVGALMVGEREERVRMRGRQYQRLIESKLDVSAMKGSLLDPGFDLNGWLRTKEIVARPSPAGAAARGGPHVPSGAAIKGTQAINLAQLAAMAQSAGGGGDAKAGAPAGGQIKGTQAINLAGLAAAMNQKQAPPPGPPPPYVAMAASPAGPAHAGPPGSYSPPMQAMGAPPPAAHMPHQAAGAPDPGSMLSIGLRMPSHYIAQASASGPAAYLESAGRRWDVRAAVVSIGRDPSCPVVISDPGVSHVHAQITRYGQDLFLRDLGSRNGTAVNGVSITVPHLLRDGDTIVIGRISLVFRSAQPSAGPARPQLGIAAFYGSNVGHSASAVQPVLTVQSGQSFGLSFAVQGTSMSVGRDPACTIRLDDMTVSRQHAMLTFNNNAWYVSDMQSTSGTRKNGERLPPGQYVPVALGDLIQFGETVFRFETRPIAAG
jgi:NADPH-dependent 2,4-dienoyl-CoA reductase/sulfur reductase-like enzyme/pSer/pThr/pTyr-binding forkhead associated (FHA) protein